MIVCRRLESIMAKLRFYLMLIFETLFGFSNLQIGAKIVYFQVGLERVGSDNWPLFKLFLLWS
jgi:hypothetical protein